ncbi:MAG: hypothetical protein E7D27_11520 [Clostridium celatum]|nr:hypothetical protein [Clostridium celatum]
MTKKELMIKAHKMTKEIKNEYPGVDYKFQLGLCLAYLHEEGEKEMRELKGTEKQVKWAEDIRKEMLQNIEMMREKPAFYGQYIARELGEDFPTAIRRDEVRREERRVAGSKYLDKAQELIEKEERAVAFINRRTMLIADIATVIKWGRIY